jgi:hypothetical protein
MVEGGFEAWPGLDELFPVNFQGVQPSRGLEGSVIDTSRTALSDRMQKYFSASTFADASKAVPELVEARAGGYELPGGSCGLRVIAPLSTARTAETAAAATLNPRAAMAARAAFASKTKPLMPLVL